MKQIVIRTFASISGVIYLLIGAIQLSTSFGIENGVIRNLLIAPDPIRGAALLLIGTVFLAGAAKAGKDGYRLVSFTIVGIGLAFILSLTSILLLAAGYMENAIILGEEFLIDEHAGPGIYLVIVPILGSLLLHRHIKDRGGP